MSDPFCDACVYCGSPEVLDDAWFCNRRECWKAYEAEYVEAIAYEKRTPLTRSKARGDLVKTKAFVWGIAYGQMIDAADRLVALAL